MIEVRPYSYDEALRLREVGTFGFALDSAPGASAWSRWSYLPGTASRVLRCDARGMTTYASAKGATRLQASPTEVLEGLGRQMTEEPCDGPPFKGGWIGYLSYDLGRYFERLPERAADDLGLPLFAFTYHDRVVAMDHGERQAYECFVDSYREAPIPLPPAYGLSRAEPRSTFDRAEYEAAVRRAVEYVAAGDVFQVNLSQRFTAGLPFKPAVLYERLRRQFPAWFGAYLDYGDHAILCNSPELFLRVTPGDRRVVTRPIKGTRARGEGMEEALLRSEKDRAELNMIVDLERNDLGRVCEIGSVRVTEPRVIEAHPTVYHGAATVEGTLRPDVGFVELLRATFPGGSVTGAPKIRAMEIIEELEPVRRGPYCGAIGYLSVDGHVEFNVAIRTIVARGDRAYFSVGGGIVADSDPAAEYEETLVKARAMVAALAGGERSAARRGETGDR